MQFYDVIVDGTVYERNAWSYEGGGGAVAAVLGRIGFWQDVELA